MWHLFLWNCKTLCHVFDNVLLRKKLIMWEWFKCVFIHLQQKLIVITLKCLKLQLHLRQTKVEMDQRSWIHVFRNTSGDVDEDKCSQQGTSWKWFHCGVRGVSYSIYEGIPPRPSCPWFAERSQQNEWKLQWCLDLQGTAVVSSPTHQPAALSRRRRRRLSFITSLKLWALRWGAQKRLNCKQGFRSALPAETPPWPTCPSCPERITAAGRTAVERGNALTPGTADGSVESNSVSVFRNWNSVVYSRK